MKKKLYSVVKNGGLFVLLIVIALFIFSKNYSLKEVFYNISKVDVFYIIVAIFSMCLFIFCDAINLGRILKMFKYDISFFDKIKYALVGFFFCSITPSASGGQPMQVYYMYKDKIELSHSTLTLLISLASFQFVTVSFAITSYIIQFKIFRSSLDNIQYWAIFGIFVNLSVLLFILSSIFSKKAINKFPDFLYKILNFFHYKKSKQVFNTANDQIKKYKEGAKYLKKNKLLVIKIVLTTAVQITALNSITFWIYKSFGLSDFSFLPVLALQSVLFIAVSYLPLPGAVGISESGFLMLFKILFKPQILSSAMLLSRSISFYLFVILSGIFILTIYLVKFIKYKNNT